MSIRVLLIEDHELFRIGLKHVLDRTSGIEVVGEATDLRTGIQAVQETEVDVVLLDLDLPDASGLVVLRSIRAEAGEAAVLVVSCNEGNDWAERVLAAGGHGFVDKSAQFPELITAVRAVHAGRCFISVERSEKLIRQDEPAANSEHASPHANLSEREIEVLSRIARGQTNKQAADELFLSVKTVETYRSRMMRKLGVSGRAELFQYAHDTGLLTT